jgi:hypothetical protein
MSHRSSVVGLECSIFDLTSYIAVPTYIFVGVDNALTN